MGEAKKWVVNFTTTAGTTVYISVGLNTIKDAITSGRKAGGNTAAPVKPVLPWALQSAFDKFDDMEKSLSGDKIKLALVVLDPKNKKESTVRSVGGIGV